MKLSEFNWGQLNVFCIAYGAVIVSDYLLLGIIFILCGFAIIPYRHYYKESEK